MRSQTTTHSLVCFLFNFQNNHHHLNMFCFRFETSCFWYLGSFRWKILAILDETPLRQVFSILNFNFSHKICWKQKQNTQFQQRTHWKMVRKRFCCRALGSWSKRLWSCFNWNRSSIFFFFFQLNKFLTQTNFQKITLLKYGLASSGSVVLQHDVHQRSSILVPKFVQAIETTNYTYFAKPYLSNPIDCFGFTSDYLARKQEEMDIQMNPFPLQKRAFNIALQQETPFRIPIWGPFKVSIRYRCPVDCAVVVAIAHREKRYGLKYIFTFHISLFSLANFTKNQPGWFEFLSF